MCNHGPPLACREAVPLVRLAVPRCCASLESRGLASLACRGYSSAQRSPAQAEPPVMLWVTPGRDRDRRGRRGRAGRLPAPRHGPAMGPPRRGPATFSSRASSSMAPALSSDCCPRLHTPSQEGVPTDASEQQSRMFRRDHVTHSTRASSYVEPRKTSYFVARSRRNPILPPSRGPRAAAAGGRGPECCLPSQAVLVPRR